MPGGGSKKAPPPPRLAGANKGRNSPLRRFHGSGSGGSGKPSEDKMRMEAASRALAQAQAPRSKAPSVAKMTKPRGTGGRTVKTVTAGP